MEKYSLEEIQKFMTELQCELEQRERGNTEKCEMNSVWDSDQRREKEMVKNLLW